MRYALREEEEEEEEEEGEGEEEDNDLDKNQEMEFEEDFVGNSTSQSQRPEEAGSTLQQSKPKNIFCSL